MNLSVLMLPLSAMKHVRLLRISFLTCVFFPLSALFRQSYDAVMIGLVSAEE